MKENSVKTHPIAWMFAGPRRQGGWRLIVGPMVITLNLAAVVGFGFWGRAGSSGEGQRLTSASQGDVPTQSAQLVRLRALNQESSDLALMNLRCAQELPGAEELNIQACLTTLDQWARRVQSETERHFYRFKASPKEFENSEEFFRMLVMAVVLYEDFGVRYSPQRIATPTPPVAQDGFFADSRDVFLHGLLGPRRTGTCSSLPVLYVALGRRLGYPLKLVTTKGHLFVRWESGRERFNVEATGKGLKRYEDAHYRHWPFPLTAEEIQTEGYLKSLSPAEELAVFLSIRGFCLMEAGRFGEAEASFLEAADLAPEVKGYRVLQDPARAKAGNHSSKSTPGEGTGSIQHSDGRDNLVGRVPSRGEENPIPPAATRPGDHPDIHDCKRMGNQRPTQEQPEQKGP